MAELGWAGLGWAGLHWVGLSVLYWTVLVCAGLCRRWAGLHWAGLCWAELCCAGSCWSVLFGAGLGCARLDQAGVCVCVEGGGSSHRSPPLARSLSHRSCSFSFVLPQSRSLVRSPAASLFRWFFLPLARSLAPSLAFLSLSLLCSLLRSPPQTLVQPFSTSFRA